MVLLVSLVAPASADSTESVPESVQSADADASSAAADDPAAAAAEAAQVERVAELEFAIRAEQDRLLSLISQKSASDDDGFREADALRESAKRLPALQRDLAIARRSGPQGWRSEPE